MKLLDLFEDRELRIKAGFMPYLMTKNGPSFMFMVSSNSKYGGPDPAIAKGRVEPGENPQEGAIREAEEELGLRKSNLKSDTIRLAWKGILSGLDERYTFLVFMGEVKNQRAFDQPHYETGATHWMTLDEFRKSGRRSHLHIVEAATSLLSQEA